MIKCFNDAVEKRLLECFAHAINLDILSEFLERLTYLSTYARRGDFSEFQPATECEFGYDFAEYSLSFVVKYYSRSDDSHDGWSEQVMHGGLIFHPGYTSRDDSLSVSLDTSNQPRWEVHT